MVAHGQEVFRVDRRYREDEPWEVIYKGPDSPRAIEVFNRLS